MPEPSQKRADATEVFISVSAPKGGAVILQLENAWTIGNIPQIQDALKQQAIPSGMNITLNGKALKTMDTSGAWALVSFLRTLGKDITQLPCEELHDNHRKVLEIISHIEHPDCIPRPPLSLPTNFLVHVGKESIAVHKNFYAFIIFFGQCCITILNLLRRPQRFRLRSVVYHVNEVGIKAIPIIALMAFLISLVTGYQGAYQLEKFGATIFTVDLVAISVLREMGVLIAAIMVAGRSSSAFAAQIGVMQVNEEVDAMRTIGLDPFELLVLPRILGILIALPALTFIADIFGLLGAQFVSSVLIDMPTLQFMERLRDAVSPSTFWIGLVKAPAFAILIGMVGCMQGLQVRNSAAEVGARTTTAVVQAIFMVMIADALFSVLFTMMGI